MTGSWAKIFPFVRSTDEYAGRLTGFHTGGSDFIYFMTVFFPFILTVLFGAVMLGFATVRKSLFLFGSSLVIAAAPFISLTGDYLEMGSIVVTRMVSGISSLFDYQVNIWLYRFRSDDLFRLFMEISEDPRAFGIGSAPGWMRAIVIIVLSQALGFVLAVWTYALSRPLASRILGTSWTDREIVAEEK